VLTIALATIACGLTSPVDGVRYDVHESRGHLACTTVKRAATHFLRDGTNPTGWTCFRGHGTSPYAASCAHGKTVTVRIYAPT
jgi:hypothetical protein